MSGAEAPWVRSRNFGCGVVAGFVRDFECSIWGRAPRVRSRFWSPSGAEIPWVRSRFRVQRLGSRFLGFVHRDSGCGDWTDGRWVPMKIGPDIGIMHARAAIFIGLGAPSDMTVRFVDLIGTEAKHCRPRSWMQKCVEFSTIEYSTCWTSPRDWPLPKVRISSRVTLRDRSGMMRPRFWEGAARGCCAGEWEAREGSPDGAGSYKRSLRRGRGLPFSMKGARCGSTSPCLHMPGAAQSLLKVGLTQNNLANTNGFRPYFAGSGR